MQTITTIGLDIAKSVFQVHGVDAFGGVVVRRQLKRRYVMGFFQKLPPCLVSPMSNARRMMPPMPRRSARRCSGRACASCQPRLPSSKAA